jgi:sorting nexin-29
MWSSVWRHSGHAFIPIFPVCIDNTGDAISIDELNMVLKNIKNRKTPGSDGINTELIKYAPQAFLYRFLDFTNICWRYGHIPTERNEAVIVPIFKKGDRKDCNDYRVISLLNSGYKIYAKLIAQRLSTIADTMLLEEQNGFRINRSCIDGVFSTAQLIEKHREYNTPTYIAFIDYEKAFYTISRTKLWKALNSKGIPQHLIRAIKSLCVNTKINISMRNKTSANYRETKQGVKQGCPVSPILFNLYIDEVTREWQKESQTHYIIIIYTRTEILNYMQ